MVSFQFPSSMRSIWVATFAEAMSNPARYGVTVAARSSMSVGGSAAVQTKTRPQTERTCAVRSEKQVRSKVSPGEDAWSSVPSVA
jgi:hypothetical protein